MPRRGSELVRGALASIAIACGERTSTAETAPASKAEPVATAPRTATGSLGDVAALVPEGATTWFAIRDPIALIHGLEWATRGQHEAWALLSRAYAPADVAEIVATLPTLDSRLEGSGVHLDRGLALATVGGDELLVIAADEPDDLPKLYRVLSGRDTSIVCEPIAHSTGFQVCAMDGSTRAAYRPRGDVALVDQDVAAVGEYAGVAKISVDAKDAMLQIAVHVADVDLGAPRVPTTMAAMIAGSSFLWMSDDPLATVERVAATLKDAELVTDLILATSGEWLLSSPGGPLGLVLLTGASKPEVLRRLVKRSPELLPWLTSFVPGLRMVPDATAPPGRSFEVAIFEQDLDDEIRASLESFELQPRAMLIATDTWLVASFGLGDSAIGELSEHPVAPVPPELLAALPPAMAASLGGGRSSFALHLELDGLHAQDVGPYLVEAFGRERLLGDTERSAALLASMSAVSSFSLWSDVGAEGRGGTVHIALRAFGDAQTAEGRDVYAARLAVEDGTPPALVYGVLRERYRDSPRAHAYVARAGVGGLSTSYPAVANLLMVDSAIRVTLGR